MTWFFRYKRGYKYFDRMKAELQAPVALFDTSIVIPTAQVPSGFTDCFAHGFSVPLTIIDAATGAAWDCEAMSATPSGSNLQIELTEGAQVALPQGAIVACRLTARTVHQHGAADWSASSSAKPWIEADPATYPHTELDSYGGWQSMTIYPEDGQTTFVEVRRHVDFNYKTLKIGLPLLNQYAPSIPGGGDPIPFMPHTPIAPCFVVLNFSAPEDEGFNEFNYFMMELSSEYIIMSPETWPGWFYEIGRDYYDYNNMQDTDIYAVLLKIWPGPSGRWMIEFLKMPTFNV